MFNNQLAKKFLTHMSPSLVEGDYENITKSDDLSMGRIIEQYPLRGNLLTHLDENGVNSWDYVDKKCKYHRKESNQGSNLANKIVRKHLGKTYNELKILFLNKRYQYFITQSMLSFLDEVKDDKDSDFIFNSDNKIEVRFKKVTTKSNYNPYLYRSFNIEDLLSSTKSDLPMIERFEKFIKMLEYKGYSVDISETSIFFTGKNIKGYASIDSNYSAYFGLVFADYYEYFNKVSRCPLVFDIPKSKLGVDSALKELEYLGTKSAKKELYNDTYQPKHVDLVCWWNR